MSSVGFCWRTQLRHRRAAVIGFGAVLGVIVSVSLATAAGARRTGEAYPGLLRISNPADLVVFDSTPNPQIPTLTAESVAALPGVAERGRIRVLDGFDGGPPNFTNVFGSPDSDAFTTGAGVNRLHLRAGRSFDPGRLDEVLVDYSVAVRDHLHPGSRMELRLAPPVSGGPRWIPDNENPRTFSFTVVGIVATPGQFPPETGFYWSGPATYLTPAFLRAHDSDLSWYEANVLRLTGGAAAVGAFTQSLSAVDGGFQPVAIPMGGQNRLTERSFHLQVVALWILGGLLGLAALMVVVDLIVRQVSLDSRDWPTLQALGMRRGDLVRLGLATTAATAAVAALVAVLGAVALSPLTPFGVVRYAEVHPGLAFDATVLLGGAGALIVSVVAAAVVPLFRVARGGASRLEEGARARPGVAARIAGGLPISAHAGVRMALEPGRGRTAVPVRSTLGAGVVGVAALVAALTFGVSLEHLVGTPRLYGVSWDAEITNNNGPDAAAAGIDVVRADPDVQAEAWVYGVPGTFGPLQTNIQVLEPLAGAIHPVILAGREPAAPEEVALGIRTMHDLHVRIGSRLPARAIEGTAPLPVVVVGQAVLEPGDTSGSLGNGAAMTLAGLNRLAQGSTTFPPFILAVQFKPGVDVARASRSLQDRLQAVDQNFGVGPPVAPDSLVDFGQVNYLPYVAGGLLGLVALLVLVHLIVTAVRRRRRDLAILKTIGFTRAQVLRLVLWQATSLGVAVVVIGVPLGIATGRWMWNALATQQGILPEPVAPALLIAAAAAGLLLAANLASIIPAVVAGRTRPALVLRAE